MAAASDASVYRRKASKYAAKNKYAKALSFYRKVCDEVPNDFKAWVKVGDMCRALGRTDKALEAYHHAANGFGAIGKLLPAIGVYKVILELQPHNVEAQYQLEQLYQQREQKTETSFSSDTLAQLKRKSDVAPPPPPEPAEIETEVEDVDDDAADDDVDEVLADMDASLHHAVDNFDEIEIEVDTEPLPPLFEGLSVEQFRAVVDSLERQTVPEGEFILREGGHGHHFYILVSGEASVYKQDDQGEERKLGTMRDGAFFGEIALFESIARTASIKSDSECELLIVDQVKLLALLVQYPELREPILQFYRKRLLRTVLKFHPAFAELSESVLWSLLNEFAAETVEPGSIIVRTGDPVNHLCVLERGELVGMIEGAEEPVPERLGGGDFVCAPTFVAGGNAEKTFVAATQSVVFALPRAAFDVLHAEYPSVAETLGG